MGRSDKRFNALFRRAKFDVSHLDFPLTIYRGGSPDDRWIGWGKSWTLSPEIAAWFALEYGRTGRPDNIVVKRILRQRRQVLAHFTGRGEGEIIVAGGGPAELHGTPNDWRAWAQHHQATMPKYVDS